MDFEHVCGNCHYWHETDVPARGTCYAPKMKGQNTKSFETCKFFTFKSNERFTRKEFG